MCCIIAQWERNVLLLRLLLLPLLQQCITATTTIQHAITTAIYYQLPDKRRADHVESTRPSYPERPLWTIHASLHMCTMASERGKIQCQLTSSSTVEACVMTTPEIKN